MEDAARIGPCSIRQGQWPLDSGHGPSLLIEQIYSPHFFCLMSLQITVRVTDWAILVETD